MAVQIPETMSDPNTPSITESTPTSQTISLGDLAQRYLGAMQRIFDITAYLVEGTRRVDERTYDEFSAAVRFLPSQKEHQGFAATKDQSERWLLKNLLAESLSLIVPLLEDVRSICALSRWQAAGTKDETALRRILSDDRKAFLALDLAEKFKHLDTNYAVNSPLTAQVLAFAKLGVCLAARRGVVSEQDVTTAGALTIKLVALDLVPTRKPEDQGGGATLAPQVGELVRSFSIGETVRLGKPDYLNVVTTLSIFANSLMKSVQEWVKKQQGA